MGNPGGTTGVGRVGTALLPTNRLPERIIFSTVPGHESWISWRHCHHIVDFVKAGKLDTGGQYKRLRAIIQTVSPRKKLFFYNSLSGYLSQPSLEFLFDGSTEYRHTARALEPGGMR